MLPPNLSPLAPFNWSLTVIVYTVLFSNTPEGNIDIFLSSEEKLNDISIFFWLLLNEIDAMADSRFTAVEKTSEISWSIGKFSLEPPALSSVVPTYARANTIGAPTSSFWQLRTRLEKSVNMKSFRMIITSVFIRASHM
jgi:hypothetical protein